MKSFLHFTEEVNLASGLTFVGPVTIYGMPHKLYLSNHATQTRERNRSKRVLLSNVRLRSIVTEGLDKFIQNMGEAFIRQFDEFHANIRNEEKVNPYLHPIRIYYPIKSLDEMYDSEKLFEYESQKREESFKEYEQNMTVENRYNYLVISLGKNEKHDNVDLSNQQMTKSRKENKTIQIKKDIIHLVDYITIISAICDGKKITQGIEERTDFIDKKSLINDMKKMDLVRRVYNNDPRNSRKLRADGYEILI